MLKNMHSLPCTSQLCTTFVGRSHEINKNRNKTVVEAWININNDEGKVYFCKPEFPLLVCISAYLTYALFHWPSLFQPASMFTIFRFVHTHHTVPHFDRPLITSGEGIDLSHLLVNSKYFIEAR